MNSESTEVKVLVLGDSKMRLKSIFAYLERMNIQPLTAKSIKEAIDIYRHEQPDIILMEYQLADIDCQEFSREIRALDMRGSWTSIIFLNSRINEEVLAR